MPRILLLEDYPPLRRAQAVTLQRSGWQVVSATSAEEALCRVAHDDFDVLLVDMDMVAGESWTVLQALNANQDGPAVVVIFSSGSQRQRAIEVLGVKVSLRKPVNRETLLRGVTEALAETDMYAS